MLCDDIAAMLVRHSNPVEALVHWVKQYKEENKGCAPSKADIPAELGPLWSQWTHGMRPMPMRVDLHEESRGEAAVTRDCTKPCKAASPTSAASDGQKSHISETPTKSKAHGDVECTSRPGGLYGHMLSPSAIIREPQRALPSGVEVNREGQRTPRRTPRKKIVKRIKRLERDAENVGTGDQPSPQRAQKTASGQDASLLSPLKSPLRTLLQSMATQNGLLSPSSIRPGLIRRKMQFAGSLTGDPPLQPLAAITIQQGSDTPAPCSAHGSLGSRLPQQREAPAQQAAPEPKMNSTAGSTAAEPVRSALPGLCRISKSADPHVQPPLSAAGEGGSSQHVQTAAHASLMPARHSVLAPSSLARETGQDGQRHGSGSDQAWTHERQASKGMPQRLGPVRHAYPFNTPMSHAQDSAAKQFRASLVADVTSTAASKPAITDRAGTASTEAAHLEKGPAARLTRLSRQALSEGSKGVEDKRAGDDDGSSSNSDGAYSFQESSDEEREDVSLSSSATVGGKASNRQTVPQLRARLKQHGLSTAGNKKDLEARLRQNAASIAGPQQQGALDLPQEHPADQSKAKSRGASSTGVFKSQKRKNFVRINLKTGGTQGRFRSKHGGKPTSRRFGRFGRFKPKALPQAGQGQDYVEGCSNKTYTCYKCHMPGHWARDCPGERADGQDARPAEEYPGGPPPDSLPRAVPAPEALPEEAISEEALTAPLQATFGFSSYRRLQLPVIQSVLSGQNTFAIMPTGAGKSLCYQIPALLSGGLVLVVSPLIALMKDQLAHLPPGLPGAMLWSGQQATEALKTLAAIREGRVRVLYVSPERVGSSSLRAALAPLLPLPLVCIDEAHCISEWGHNFRSAYFRLGGLLREYVPSRSVLALTATATRSTEASVARALGIAPGCVFRDASLRANLRLHVAHVNGGTEAGSTRKALLRLLRPGGALASAGAVIAYATFQMQAEQVAQFLTARGVKAAAYHAGKHMKERELVQGMFSKGQLRVVVATVAFGMGIDASFVRAVVHLSMPQSLEEYVQQVGRAGRDGQEAQCHLFLDDADFRRLHSLSNSDSVAASSVQAFLEEAFQAAEDAVPSAEDSESRASLAMAVLAAQELYQRMDLKVEVMETLLSYLEAHEEGYVRVLPPVGRTVKVAFYSDSCDSLAQSRPLLQAMLGVCSKPRSGTYSVQVARWANAAGRLPSDILQELASLARQDMLRFELDSKPTLAFQVVKEPEDLEALAKELTVRHTRVGRQRMQRLDTMYRTMAQAAKNSGQQQQEDSIRAAAEAYFDRGEDAPEAPTHGISLPLSEKTGFLAKDVRMLLRDTSEKISAQALARIMHGISSAAYPASKWKKCGYWGRYSDVDFAYVLQIAEREVE